MSTGRGERNRNQSPAQCRPRRGFCAPWPRQRYACCVMRSVLAAPPAAWRLCLLALSGSALLADHLVQVGRCPGRGALLRHAACRARRRSRSPAPDLPQHGGSGGAGSIPRWRADRADRQHADHVSCAITQPANGDNPFRTRIRCRSACRSSPGLQAGDSAQCHHRWSGARSRSATAAALPGLRAGARRAHPQRHGPRRRRQRCSAMPRRSTSTCSGPSLNSPQSPVNQPPPVKPH